MENQYLEWIRGYLSENLPSSPTFRNHLFGVGLSFANIGNHGTEWRAIMESIDGYPDRCKSPIAAMRSPLAAVHEHTRLCTDGRVARVMVAVLQWAYAERADFEVLFSDDPRNDGTPLHEFGADESIPLSEAIERFNARLLFANFRAFVAVVALQRHAEVDRELGSLAELAVQWSLRRLEVVKAYCTVLDLHRKNLETRNDALLSFAEFMGEAGSTLRKGYAERHAADGLLLERLSDLVYTLDPRDRPSSPHCLAAHHTLREAFFRWGPQFISGFGVPERAMQIRSAFDYGHCSLDPATVSLERHGRIGIVRFSAADLPGEPVAAGLVESPSGDLEYYTVEKSLDAAGYGLALYDRAGTRSFYGFIPVSADLLTYFGGLGAAEPVLIDGLEPEYAEAMSTYEPPPCAPEATNESGSAINPAYAFAHILLPRFAFEHGGRTVDELLGDGGAEIIENLKASAKLLDEIAIHPFAAEGFRGAILEMPKPQKSPDPYFIGILADDARRMVRYITLEKAPSLAALLGMEDNDEFEAMLCEWSEQGHSNRGAVKKADLRSFEAILTSAAGKE